MKIMVTMLLFVLEIVKYEKAYDICLSGKLRRMWITGVFGALLLGIFLLFPEITSSGRHIIVYSCTLVTMLFMMQEKWEERIVNLLEIFFLLICMDEVVNISLKLLRLYTKADNRIELGDSLAMSFVSLLLLGGIGLLKEKRADFWKKFWNVVSEKLYYLVVMMVIGMLVTVSGLNYAEKYVSNPKFSLFTIFLCAISYISIGTLGIFVFYIKRTNRKIEGMLQREVWSKNMQQYYYEELLEREEDTKRYRHDMINHLLCLNSFAEQQDMQALKKYLEKMQKQANRIQRKCYATGNQILDIVTNYYLNGLKGEADIHISGQTNEKLLVDNMMLCTIYGNLLQNAVEELQREEKRKAFLWIDFLQGEEYFQITIQNSLSDQSGRKEDMLATGKQDKKNHGIGLKNVRKAVADCGGKLAIFYDKECFKAEVILPNK